jgi:endonuclease/exonuclease/phosphatase family metal-dependent hydrolase
LADDAAVRILADSLWPQFAYGRNAVYPEGDHGNALLSKFQIIRHDNLDVSISGHENRGVLHCVLRLPGEGPEVHASAFTWACVKAIALNNSSCWPVAWKNCR